MTLKGSRGKSFSSLIFQSVTNVREGEILIFRSHHRGVVGVCLLFDILQL